MRMVYRLAILGIVTVSITLAQGSSSAILGLVTDSSGAVVPGAAVTATHSETNQGYRTITTGDGYFQIPSLPVGAYEVGVAFAGFKHAVRAGLLLQVDEK